MIKEANHYIEDDCYIDNNGNFVECKTLRFYTNWDGEDGSISVDKLLILLQEHFPNTPHSSIALTIRSECDIIVFDKRTIEHGDK